MTILLSLAVYSAGLFQLMHVLMARHFYTEEYFPKSQDGTNQLKQSQFFGIQTLQDGRLVECDYVPALKVCCLPNGNPCRNSLVC